MSDVARMNKAGLLREYKRNLYGTNEKDKEQNNDYQREYVPEVILSENPLILPGLESLYMGWGLPDEE